MEKREKNERKSVKMRQTEKERERERKWKENGKTEKGESKEKC